MNKVKIDLDLIIDEIDAIKKDIARYKFELKQLEQEQEKRELQLMAFLGQLDVKEMQHKNYVFGFETLSRTAFDQKLFAKEHEDLYNKYKLTKEKEDFYCKLV